MLYTKGLRGVKIYCGDELIGESPVCYSNEPVYEFEQDVESGKWYLYADGIRVCEIFPKTEKITLDKSPIWCYT